MKTRNLCTLFFALLALPLLSILNLSCDSNESKQLYEKDWTADLSAYLDTDYGELVFYSLADYGVELIDDQKLLLYEFCPKGRHLVELDFHNGSFLQKSTIDFGLGHVRRRADGSILLSGYNSQDHITGIYDKSAHSFSLLATATRDEILDNPSLGNPVYPGDSHIFTYDPNLSGGPESEVYLAKWNFEGTLEWKKNVDATNLDKIAAIKSVRSDHLLFTSARGIASGGIWKVGKISVSSGVVLWHKP